MKLYREKVKSMLKKEKENKFYALECIKFYNSKIKEYQGASIYYIALRDNAMRKVDESDIQIDYLERELEEI